MTLQQATEPIFQYICRLNRIARRSGPKPTGETSFLSKPGAAASAPAAGRAIGQDYGVVRAEIKALFEDLVTKSMSDARLSQQVQKMELPLLFFVDSMISDSQLSYAQQWNQNRLSYDRNELAGDEKFFDMLDETAKETGEDAAERLAVYYTCMGLGFTGIYFKQPEFLRKTMLTIAPRIRHLVEMDQNARICPEAYEKVDTRNLVLPPSNSLVLVALLFACFMVAIGAAYFVLYRQASANLNSSLQQVIEQDSATTKP